QLVVGEPALGHVFLSSVGPRGPYSRTWVISIPHSGGSSSPPCASTTRGGPMPKVLYEKRDRIAYVTLNRPEAKNAIDPETHQLLWATWEDFRDDDALDVAILTGTGDAFCAGADLKTFIPPLMGATPQWVRDNVR